MVCMWNKLRESQLQWESDRCVTRPSQDLEDLLVTEEKEITRTVRKFTTQLFRTTQTGHVIPFP